MVVVVVEAVVAAAERFLEEDIAANRVGGDGVCGGD